jgi:Fur family ferric uptake transcriptional regulator
MDNKRLIGDLLHAHGLKKTLIRTEILELFMNHDFALSASDIAAKMKARHDRVTVYRALSSFQEHGLLHKASEDGQGVKYALCGHSCPYETHADRHAHFVCDQCNQTYCLEGVEVPQVEVSDDFSVNKVNFTLSGVCKECNA